MRLNQEQIIQHMKDGWKLGYASTSNKYWLQKPDLACGGESKNLHGGSVRCLIRNGKIKACPHRDSDRYWMTRLELRKDD